MTALWITCVPMAKLRSPSVYEDGKPAGVDTIVVSTQHAAEIEDMGIIKNDMIKHVIAPVMDAEGIDWRDADI